jgi:hypothetical protein
MVGSFQYLCSAGWKFCNHSTKFLVCRICRFDVILSQMMKRNIITLMKEIADPIDEMMFHVV